VLKCCRTKYVSGALSLQDFTWPQFDEMRGKRNLFGRDGGKIYLFGEGIAQGFGQILGGISENTRPKGSWEGMPFSSGKNVRSHASCERPNSAMLHTSHPDPSAPRTA
jgi:hypothetical protein